MVVVPDHKHFTCRSECMQPPTAYELQVWLAELVYLLDMKILSGPHAETVTDQEGNNGPTAVVIIETSHMAVHVWDEVSPALVQVDVYTCGAFDRQIVLDHMEQWHPTKVEFKVIDREFTIEDIT